MLERTRQDIIDAFNRLITRVEFEQITAQSIAEEACISKATFYRYFKDKYDVMNHNYKQVLDTNLLRESTTNYRNLYCNLYKDGETRLRAIKGAFKSTGINSFENYIYSYSTEVVERITRMNRSGEGLTETEKLQLDVFCYGISYMYKKWIFGQYDIDPEEAADKLFELMPVTLRDYWFI